MESGGDGVKQDRESSSRVVVHQTSTLLSRMPKGQSCRLQHSIVSPECVRERARAEYIIAERTVVALTTIGHPRAMALNLPCGAVMPYVLYASKQDGASSEGRGEGEGKLAWPSMMQQQQQHLPAC